MPPVDAPENEVDRGDNFTPTGENVAPPTPAPVDEAPAVDADLDTEVIGDEKAFDQDEAAAAALKDAGDDEVPSDRDEKGRFIPKDRFDEAVGKEREEKERLQSQLDALEKREADRAVSVDMQQASARVKELVKEHTKLLSDGELDQASEVMENMLQLQSDMADRRSQAYADQGRASAKSEIQYDAVVARLEMDYPEINPEDTSAFDRESVRKVQAYMTGLMQMDNMTPSKALQESVTTILGAKRAAEDENAKTDAEKAKEAEALGMRRKEAAVGKALDAKGKQPADIKDVGIDHDKEGGSLDAAAVMKMSWEEFIKLPDEKLSEMRGDHVA